jgi:SSS family solute:Na+ symporter
MVGTTTAIWMATAFLTKPTDPDRLRQFYRLARPAGPGWRVIRAQCPDVRSPDNVSAAFVGWFAGLALVYGALFGSGHLLLGNVTAGLVASAIAAAGGIVLAAVLPRLWSSEPAAPAASPR